jgi:hypothetical protein
MKFSSDTGVDRCRFGCLSLSLSSFIIFRLQAVVLSIECSIRKNQSIALVMESINQPTDASESTSSTVWL